MVDLKEDSEDIKEFIKAGLDKFSKEVQKPVMIGVYCCPWSGWISLNFNINYRLDETFYSCPDFEFVEYDMLEFKHWEEEYESWEGIWTDSNLKIYYGHGNDGDEGLNRFVFSYLKEVIINLNEKYKLPPTLLQFLDSNCWEKII